MSRKTHISIFGLSFFTAVVLGLINYETKSVSGLLFTKENLLALIIYSIFFMAITYTGVWMYTEAKAILKKKSF